MRKAVTLLAVILFAQQSTILAQGTNLLPKYGQLPKPEWQKQSDAAFLAAIDKEYKGNRKKAAKYFSNRGWEFLLQGDPTDAMMRFNQAWLLDNSNGYAIWGMAAIQGDQGRLDESLTLFAEAESLIGDNLNLSTDYAKVLAMAGVEKKNDALLKDAYARFERIYKKAPKHTINLEGWAFALYYAGNYAEAWKKLKLAEATPHGREVNPELVKALQSKMPRP